MDDTRFAALEARVQAAEDQLEIIRLLMSYGPLADSGEIERTSELWTEDGVYDPSGVKLMQGRGDVQAMLREGTHQKIIHTGSGHLTLTPKITVNGDTAEATGYSLLVLKGEEGWKLPRASAVHWTLKRTPEGWRVANRVNRLLDGSEDARALFRQIAP